VTNGPAHVYINAKVATAKMEQSSDQEVVSAVLAGDVNAYAILVRRYQKPIYNLMWRMTGSYPDALDLAQETFIKAYEALDRFRQGSRFFPWLYSIGLNHARNFLRRRKAHPTVDMDELARGLAMEAPAGQAAPLGGRLEAMAVQKALETLPVDYREALVLRFHEELSMDQIACALSISLSGAKMRVHRGLKKLHAMLATGSNGSNGHR
jgi:RNA polymerase sigma-70 factor (ECF subfamily)